MTGVLIVQRQTPGTCLHRRQTKKTMEKAANANPERGLRRNQTCQYLHLRIPTFTTVRK
jgi:hypothetical protein